MKIIKSKALIIGSTLTLCLSSTYAQTQAKTSAFAIGITSAQGSGDYFQSYHVGQSTTRSDVSVDTSMVGFKLAYVTAKNNMWYITSETLELENSAGTSTIEYDVSGIGLISYHGDGDFKFIWDLSILGVEESETTSTTKQSGTAARLGIGAAYQITSGLDINLMYSSLGTEAMDKSSGSGTIRNKIEINNILLGLNYRF